MTIKLTLTLVPTNKSILLLTANWDGFHDNETGIYGYTWSVGSDVCLDDVSAHIDPHSHLFDESEWTHEGIVTGVHLAGDVYISRIGDSILAINQIKKNKNKKRK